MNEWVRKWDRTVVLVLGLIFLAGCIAGVVTAIAVYGPRDGTGQLSAWVPGTVTALTLVYTLLRQSRIEERQAADEASRIEREKWEQAEKVYVWVDNDSRGQVLLRWSNSSDLPALNVMATLQLSDGSTADEAIGIIEPRAVKGERALGYFVDPHNWQRRPYPVSVSCRYRDARNQWWSRDPSGALRIET
jgi:hypothetical protein